MPRNKRTQEEIDKVKEKIIQEAIAFIAKEGLSGFSLRKLGPRLDIAPKTIYNYFRDKDEIHLIILTRGFEMLHDKLLKAYAVKKTSIKKLKEILQAVFNFAFDNPHLYIIMFVGPVPQYRTLLTDDLKNTAENEFVTYMKGVNLIIDAIKQCGTSQKPISDEEATFYLFNMWCSINGYLAGCLNSMLDYLVENPIQLREIILNQIICNFEHDLKKRMRKKSAQCRS